MSFRLGLSLAILVCALCAQLGVCVAAPAASQTLTGTQVAAVADRIADGLVTGPDRSVAAAYRVADQRLPAGEVTIATAGTPFVSSSYVGVPVAIRVDGKLVRTVVAGYRVTSYVHTAVASRDLAPGAVLEASDLSLARLPSNGRPAVGIDVLVGRRLNVATSAGAPVYVEQTMPNAVVKAGQAAILVIHDGVVALMADVIARTGGAVGDTVTVVNPQTQKAIAGIVTAPNRVELTLPGGER
ncbi:MAG TPA: flagellar basal body P-ring formation chaperone FlgA [Candidatus Elarobacter sp.]|jgi:flagella basal body P-ring formation protein FlgA|nr:flagellar basal body P-ring formation chaperone FlgA [Candidatus Elarobacter sp.]